VGTPLAVDVHIGTQYQKHMLTHVPHIFPSDDDQHDQPTSLPQASTHTVPPAISHPEMQSPTQTPSTARNSTRAHPTRSTEYHRRTYNLPSTKKLIEYLHGTIGLPVNSTLLRAVKAGNFRSFPGLSVANVERYCPTNATPTVLGHLAQVQKGLRSTR
jgi:hypothetical protein